MRIVDKKNFFENLPPASSNYLAMYSSLWRGITLDSQLMCLPIDDHIVHRGDGVFEALRVCSGKIYLLHPHLNRLQKSASGISLQIRESAEYITKVCKDLIEITNCENGILRMYVSRGPGSFSANPYESVGSQLYIVLTEYAPPSEEKFQKGVTAISSQILFKEPPFSSIKSCNYLQNVLMKKESVDEGIDYSIAITKEGFIAEGPTENIFLISQENQIVAPRRDYTLAGTTLQRVMELSEELKLSGELQGCSFDDIQVDDIYAAKEVLMVGTTTEVLPVREFNRIPLAKEWPLGKKLRNLLNIDMKTQIG